MKKYFDVFGEEFKEDSLIFCIPDLSGPKFGRIISIDDRSDRFLIKFKSYNKNYNLANIYKFLSYKFCVVKSFNDPKISIFLLMRKK